MKNSRRIKQNAVIFLAIVVLVLILWKLSTRRHYGGMGGAITTNIFGPATMTLLNGPGDSSIERVPVFSNETVSILTTNQPLHPTNRPPSGPPPAGSPPPQLTTNLLNTNGPVTMIDVPAGDLIVTPPDVTYASNVAEASAIQERLGAASAKGGDIQISLYWNDYNDLDLHCVDPKGVEINYLHPISEATAGELDVDRNARPPFTKEPVENIYWPIGKAPKGEYRIFVVFYSPRNGLDGATPTPFTVRVVLRDGQVFYFRSSVRFIPWSSKKVCTLEYDPSNPDPARRYRFTN